MTDEIYEKLPCGCGGDHDTLTITDYGCPNRELFFTVQSNQVDADPMFAEIWLNETRLRRIKELIDQALAKPLEYERKHPFDLT